MLSDEDKVALAKSAIDAAEAREGSGAGVLMFLFGKANVENFKVKLAVLVAMFGLMVLAAVIDIATGGAFHNNGIYPRRTDGMFGIVLAPFLHHSIAQLIINAAPFLILGAFVLMREDGIRVFGTLNVLIILGAGTIVWFIGEDTVHVGSYTLVCGYFSYLTLFGFLVRDWRSAGVAIIVFAVYGTTIFNMFSKAVGPVQDISQQPTSWLYMISGLGVGLFSAMLEYRYVQTGVSMLDSIKNKLWLDNEAASAEERASLKSSTSDDV